MDGKFVSCPEDRPEWEIVGEKAMQGCYIEGGNLDYYVVQEIGTYVDNQAAITSGPDSEFGVEI